MTMRPPTNPTSIAENYHTRDNNTHNQYNAGYFPSLPPVFQRWVVLETIFDPTIINESKISLLEQTFGRIRNVEEYAIKKTLPRNSILAKPVYNSRLGNKTSSNSNLLFLYPLFPSALSMPCKPGEHVWVMFESLNTSQNLGYWVCSIVGPGHNDDVNHVHPPREFEKTFLIGKENVDAASKHQDKTTKPRYHFKNGIYTILIEKEPPVITPETSIISGDSDAYERIISLSDASKLSVYESIPRFRKRPGDVALEGSNNTLIVLGRDRLGSVAPYLELSIPDQTGTTGPVKLLDPNNPTIKKKNAGSIDIVAGRGQLPVTAGRKVINHVNNEELAKDRQSVSLIPSEGDPDFINDRSRVYISQNTKVDEALALTQKNSSKNPQVLDSADGDAGVIIKSDKVRIFARSDVQILVTGFTEENVTHTPAEYELSDINNDPNQTLQVNKIKTENAESKKWASITIKSNGDIVFEPSDMGYIKLGGDDANRGIVCTAQPVNLVNGGVEAPPLLTDGGSSFAGSAAPSPTGNIPALPQTADLDLGTFSNKVLIK